MPKRRIAVSRANTSVVEPKRRASAEGQSSDAKTSRIGSRRDEPLRIRKLRNALGFTQERFARECGVTRISATAWEIGKTSPAPRAWKQMAKLAAKAAPSTAMWFWEKSGFERDDFQYLFPEFQRMVKDSELRMEQELNSSSSDAVLVPMVRTPLPEQLRIPPSPEQIEDYVSLPKHLMMSDWKLLAIRVSPRFVRPIFCPGGIVVIDASEANVLALEGQLVVANYIPSAETQELAEMQSRGRPVAAYARGRYPFLENGVYMGWLKLDPPMPESRMRQMNLNSEKLLAEQPVTIGHEFTVPIAMVDEPPADRSTIILEPEAVLIGRVVCWIAAGRNSTAEPPAYHVTEP